MTPPILVDTTRLLTRLKHAAPTGIDRVDLAYARHFLRGPYRGRAVAATPFGTRLLPGDQLAALFSVLDRRWADGSDAGHDPVLARIEAWLAGHRRDPQPEARAGGGGRITVADVGRLARSAGWRSALKSEPGSVYLHTSHLRLDRPEVFAWLDRRPDIRSVFFVHDIIPIRYPEYGVPGEDARHHVRMKTVSDRAAAVIVSSRAVRDELAGYLGERRLRVPPMEVAAIGVEPAFQAGAGPRPGSRPEPNVRRPYFVVCSTIEARKNHLLLLQIWREMAERLGSATPALVVVGRRGWESENVVDLLDRCAAIAPHVVEAGGLSTPGLVAILRGARALLMPSFAEGYGIPVVEALSLGTPVIASDLPVHREIAGGFARFCHPLDGLGWRDAILSAAHDASHPAEAGFRSPLWSDHFRIVDDLVTAL